MNFLRRMRLAVALGILLASTGSRALGGFVTYSASTQLQQLTNINTTLSVSGFDATLGTLESVTFNLSDRANILGTLFNKSASARDFSISQDVNFNVMFGGSSILNDDLNAAKTYTAVASGQAVSFGTYSLTGTTGDVTMISPDILAALTTNSAVSFAFAANANTMINGAGGNTSTSFTTKSDAVLTVTYNYITANVTVPEPASLALTALGGLLVATAGHARARARTGRVAG